MDSRSSASEIVLTRVYDAPVRAVWDAWTIPEQVEQWWGPRGFTLTTHSKDLRAGGTWRYTMHGPDGVDYPNVTTYLVVEPYRKLVYDHGGNDERAPLFRVTVTFSELNGQTTMEMISSLPSPEAATAMAKFIKQAGGNATWDRLAEHLDEIRTGKRRFVVARTFDAPIAQVFEMWVSPEHLERWLPPAGTKMRFLRSEIAPGRSALFVIAGEHGTMHVRAEYLAIEPTRRIVYTQQFVDEREHLAAAPGAPVWPAMLRTTVLLVEEGPDRTRVTVTTEPHGETTADELEAFVRERSGMTLGWTGSFDVLEGLLDQSYPGGNRGVSAEIGLG
ncbi:MAG: SRPBCC domain-containing protein [Vicinamibacterales bacterium]